MKKDSASNLSSPIPEPKRADLRGLAAHLEDAARLVWDDVAEMLREVEARHASVEELFARLLTSMLPDGLKVAPCHIFNRDGVVGPVCKLTLYDSRVWAGLPTARGTVLIPSQAVISLIEVDRVLTGGAVMRAMDLFRDLRSLWNPGQDPPLSMLLCLEGASALHIRDQVLAVDSCPLDVLGILDKWLIIFQASDSERGPLVRLGTSDERFPRIDYAGQHTPILLHQLLHQQILPEHRGAEHDALRRDLGRIVASLLPKYDKGYCREHRDRLSALAIERMQRNPTPETVLFCTDFLNYLEFLDRHQIELPRV